MAASTVVTGVRATAGTQGILSNARVIDMSDTIHLLDPNEAPLTAISMKLRTISAINPQVQWMEDDYLPHTVAMSATTAATTGDTELILASAGNQGYARVGDILKVMTTGENLLVTALSSTTNLVVVRSIGATAAGTIATGTDLMIIGNANAEFSTKRVIKTAQKVALSNTCQICRWEYGASGTVQASELYGGNDLNYQGKKAGKEFRIQMERTYLWGEKSDVGTGAPDLPDLPAGSAATPTRTSDGIIARISTNVTSATTLTPTVLETFLRTGFRYGPARKIMFASRNVVSYLSLIAGAKLETRPTDQSFPLALTEYVSPHGKLYIATHNLLEGTAGTTVNYSGWAFLLDLDSIFHRPLRGRNTMLRTNIQANDADGRIDGFLAESCIQVIQEKNHAILNDVAGFSAT